MKDIKDFDFQKGEVLLIDKPYNWTSFDVVNYIRVDLNRKLGIKKIKVGHAGTLDPLATGLVIVCTGAFTKKINEYQNMEKEYIGQITFGATTPSFDLETKIDKNYPTEHINIDMINDVAESFVGETEQYPPVYSAVKINGKRAYDYAREGKEVKTLPKMINISKFDINLFEDNTITFRIRCSKGTYIRSIANDFGKKINSGAYLSQLRRTEIGSFKVFDAISPSEFSKQLGDISK